MVFPGQGSQSQGMQDDLAAEFSEVADVYAEASQILGYDLWQLVQDGPAERLGETVVTQPAMLTAGYAAWKAWNRAGGAAPQQMAGHSLGEYTALVCAGALSFADALTVVQRRSELMQEAVLPGAGAMAAIIGLDDDAVVEVCNRAANIGVADAVNFNSPGQVVIAGDTAAIEHAIALAKERGARRAMLLPVSVPAHSALMREAGEALLETLAAVDFTSPATTVIAAADALPYGDGDDIRERLSRQVYAPVQWVSTVQAMIANGATSVIECGPGKVLLGLLRRIDKSISVSCLATAADITSAKDSQ